LKDKVHSNKKGKKEDKGQKVKTQREKVRIKKRHTAKELKTEYLPNNFSKKQKGEMLKSGKEATNELFQKKNTREDEVKAKTVEDDDICEKCHHKKGPIKRLNVKKNEEKIKSTNVKSTDDSDLSQKRTREEKEILKRYITENPTNELYCICFNHGFDSGTLKQPKNAKKAKPVRNDPGKFDF